MHMFNPILNLVWFQSAQIPQDLSDVSLPSDRLYIAFASWA